MDMDDAELVIISCSGCNEIVGAVNRAKLALPLESRKILGRIFSNYLAAYDVAGAYERMNSRSVKQIFSEFQKARTNLIDSGELDGLQYSLFDSPARLADGPRLPVEDSEVH